MTAPILPSRSLDALSALEVFYDEFNDIHFFVEDEDQENLYEAVLQKLFPGLRIARVFPLGGKEAVLAHSAAPRRGRDVPLGVHLVDKDFDDLLNIKVDRPLLFYLERYCIENYFLEAEAVVEVVIESQPRLRRADVQANLAVPDKISELAESLRTLFKLFYCVQRFGLGLKNCSLAVERFCADGKRWQVSDAPVVAYSAQVVAAAAATPWADELKDPLTHAAVLALEELEVHSVVSGKHICALLFHYIKSKYNIGTITFDSFLFRLAKNSSLESMHQLAKSMRAAVIAADARYGSLDFSKGAA